MDLLKYSLSDPWIQVGRLPGAVAGSLKKISDEASSQVRLSTKPRSALVKQYQRLFKMEGVKLRCWWRKPWASSRGGQSAHRQAGARGLRFLMKAVLP